MIQEAIAKVVRREDLSRHEMMEVMEVISSGGATHAQIGALLVGLLMKGETVDEITGATLILRSKVLKIPVDVPAENLVDIVGTGGDGAGTFNVSTTSAFVVAGCGLPVAKHGNRNVSSSCGSADVLEALGLNLDLSPEDAAACIEEVGIGFLFAPLLHPAMGHAIHPRREIRLKSIFNLIGPLTNPAGAGRQLLGVYHPSLTDVMGQVLYNLGCRGALVVHGEDGCDEMSISGPTRVTRLADGRVMTYTVTPEDAGLDRSPLAAVRGGSPDDNAAITRHVLEGRPGPCRDMVLLNSAAALMAAGKIDDLRDGVKMAAESLDSGNGLKKLTDLAVMTQNLGRRRKVVGE
jgi:anthranilate phosphoribosyltransferase